ncbi:MAG: hypothetical protein PF689_12080 [Deltaproteobacteria bacterium]|jgi:hypothetical protein|nr:hypothetical protein [Deltaproteobacteria bacterium]
MNKFKVQPITCNYNPQYPPKKLLKTRSVLQKTKNILISGGIMLLASSCTSNLDSNSETCEPGVICNDYHTALVCNENLMEESVNCHNWCQENYGTDYVSNGCQEDILEPCQCEYGFLAGVEAECYPGEERCNTNSIDICEEQDGYDGWVNYDCDQYCHEQFGYEYFSQEQCNLENSDNPCYCEYDIIDGDMPACQPGELNCNEDQLGICQEDTYSFQYVNCSDKCNEEFGNSSVSAGCDPNNLNNPCLCTEE